MTSSDVFLALSFSLTWVTLPNVFAFKIVELMSAGCGRASSRVLTGSPGQLMNSKLGSSPWHTILYRMSPSDQNKWDFACNGNIIASDIVITAASCVFAEETRIFLNASSFRIAAAKTHRSLFQDVDAMQPRKVKNIIPHSSYSGELSVHTDNLALLIVEPPFAFNDHVAPICIDWEGQTNRQLSPTTSVAGWNLRRGYGASEVLQEGSFAVVKNRQCRTVYRRNRLQRYINYDKFCINTTNSSEPYNPFPRRTSGDSGSGSVISAGGKYYLQGVLSAFLGDEMRVVTNITKHTKWLMDSLTLLFDENKCKDGFLCGNNECISPLKKCDGISDCDDKSDESKETCNQHVYFVKEKSKFGSCTLPVQPEEVTYQVEDCHHGMCTKGPGALMGFGEKMEMTCGPRTTPSQDGYRFACINGEWFPGEPECVRMCPPRALSHLVVQCEQNRVTVNCSDFMRPGTLVTASCQRLYKFRDPLLNEEGSMCMKGGKWSSDLPVCVPECGIPNLIDSATPTITYGRNATFGKYPWHVGLYHYDQSSKTWTQFCGGTIIKSYMVVTAAHCVGTLGHGDLLVAGGKVLRDLAKTEPFQQTSRVKKLMVHDRYRGISTQYENDIALVELETPFSITDFVLPCCIFFPIAPVDFLKRITEVSADIYICSSVTIRPYTKEAAVSADEIPVGVCYLFSYEREATTHPIPGMNFRPHRLDYGIVSLPLHFQTAGWGYTEKGLKVGISGSPSPVLKETQLQVAQTDECGKLDPEFQPYFTFDKFCVFFRGGSGPQKGDSGGGVVASQGGLYFLVGIVSVKPTVHNAFSAITNLVHHKDWIKANLPVGRS